MECSECKNAEKLTENRPLPLRTGFGISGKLKKRKLRSFMFAYIPNKYDDAKDFGIFYDAEGNEYTSQATKLSYLQS